MAPGSTGRGRFLVASSADGGVRVFDTATGEQVIAYEVCTDLGGLLSLARERVTRELTPEERDTYLG